MIYKLTGKCRVNTVTSLKFIILYYLKTMLSSHLEGNTENFCNVLINLIGSPEVTARVLV